MISLYFINYSCNMNMNALRSTKLAMKSLNRFRAVVGKAQFSTEGTHPHGHKEKSKVDIWVKSEVYPLFFFIGCAAVLAIGTGIYYVQNSPDARITRKAKRQPLRVQPVETAIKDSATASAK